uniref:L1 transposable element RRM domain-containing protein n=1 Tax=Salarias fasciatus TaxID=181472 RepID=A0A672IKM2_SALFA
MPPKTNRGGSNAQPNQRPATTASSSPKSDSTPPEASSCTPLLAADITALKTDLLFSLRNEVVSVFKAELQAALNENLVSIKSELLAFKTELSGSIFSVQTEVAELKNTVTEMERSLSTCTDDIVSLQNKVERLSKDYKTLEDKCEDLESRARRQNIRIIGVPEDASVFQSPTGVAKLLKEAFQLDKEPLVDRAHRSLMPKPKPGDRPRAIVAKLHYFTDCSDILKKARELQRINIHNMTISVFPDHTTKTARARAAFNDVRRQLREIEGVRYGLLHPARLRITYGGTQIFAHLKSLNFDIAFLQETHLRDKDSAKLRCPLVGDIFHSTFNSKARGVAILIHKKTVFTMSKIIS